MNTKPVFHLKPNRNRLFPVMITKDGSKFKRLARSTKQATEYLNATYGKDNIRIYDWCVFAGTFHN